jgi:hypothetical protein
VPLLRTCGGYVDVQEFFLQEYDTVCRIVNDLFLKGVSDDQMRHQPKEGLNRWHGISGTRPDGKTLRIH